MMQRLCDCSLLSKHRNALYGLSILWVLGIHTVELGSHFHLDWTFGLAALRPILFVVKWGNVGVDIFLFLSGISLYFSMAKNDDVYRFIKRRFARVVPAVLVIDTWWWAYDLLVNHSSPALAVSRFTLTSLWVSGEQTIWFVSLLLVLYVAYPYVRRFLEAARNETGRVMRCGALVAVWVTACYAFHLQNPDLFDLYEIALLRVPIFVVGCLFGRWVYEGRNLPRWWPMAVLVLIAAFVADRRLVEMGMMPRFWWRLLFATGGVGFAFLLVWLFDLLRGHLAGLRRALNSVGSASLELYLVQIALRTFLYRLGIPALSSDQVVTLTLVYVVASLALSPLAHKASSRISAACLSAVS